MDTIRTLVQSLIVIVMLTVFLEMLLPKGDMHRYVKMVMGLVVVVAVLQAVGGLFHEQFSPAVMAMNTTASQQQLNKIIQDGQKLTAQDKNKALEQYRQGIQKQIQALADLNNDLAVVGVEVKVNDKPGDRELGKISEVVLEVTAKGNVPPGSGSGVKAVEPVNIQVNSESKTVHQDPARSVDQQSGQSLAHTVANFYNLTPDQVKVVYK